MRDRRSGQQPIVSDFPFQLSTFHFPHPLFFMAAGVVAFMVAAGRQFLKARRGSNRSFAGASYHGKVKLGSSLESVTDANQCLQNSDKIVRR